MKKIVLLALIVLVGCTASDMPHIFKSSNRKNYNIRTSGEFNGYSVSEDEIIEGRTKGANYKRLLISYGENKVITRFAYDCSESKHSDCYAIHIWEPQRSVDLYFSIKKLIGLNPDYNYIINDNDNDNDDDIWLSVFPSHDDNTNFEYLNLYCNAVHIKIKAVKFLDKKEADELLATQPNVRVFISC
jgi:hypothetical protein